MTLSILLTTPWDSKGSVAPQRFAVPKVRTHRFSWKNAGTIGFPKSAWTVIPQRWIDGDDGGSAEEAEVITSSSDESLFLKLHGVLAKDANYDALAEWIVDSEYEGILDVIRDMATQHPDAMWFVKAWTVEAAAPD